MKKFSIFFTLIVSLLAFTYGVQAQDKPLKEAAKGNKVELKITGMTCGGCAATVSRVLDKTQGVLDQEVKFPGDVAVITYDPEKVKPEDLVAAIEEKTSFKAEVKKKDNR